MVLSYFYEPGLSQDIYSSSTKRSQISKSWLGHPANEWPFYNVERMSELWPQGPQNKKHAVFEITPNQRPTLCQNHIACTPVKDVIFSQFSW